MLVSMRNRMLGEFSWKAWNEPVQWQSYCVVYLSAL